ncbi:MAG: hypothetical protein ACREK6_00165, partial [Candidatus Rokuibacteriota bacterium]
MTNALAEQLMRALPEGDNPLQRLKQLAHEMGIERPTRRTKRAFLRVAQQLGIESPAETHGSSSPMLDLPPEAESVIRAREKAWRQTREEQLARAANRLQHSKVGLKVALAARDQAAGARALRALAGFEIEPDDVGRDELAFAASLTDQQIERLMGKDATLLPAPEALERGFQATRGRARIILMGNVKRQSLDGDPAQLRYEVNGLELSESVARELLGDYSPMVARRAAIKRRMTSLLESLFRDDEFPDRLPDETWAALAWLTIVGYLTPPVHMPVGRVEDGRSVPIDRWQARRMVEAEARRLGFEVGQLQASLEVARR